MGIRPMVTGGGVPAEDGASVIRDEDMRALLHGRGRGGDAPAHGGSAGDELPTSSFHDVATAFRDGFDRAYYDRSRSVQVADAAGQALGKAARHADKVVPVVLAIVAVVAVKRAVRKAIFG